MKKLLLLALFALFSSVLVLFSQDIYNANTKESVIRWEGRKLFGGHWGDVLIKSGNLEFKNNKLSGGSFVIDMNSIVVLDLDENGGKSKLEGHLRSDDFFSVDKYPTSEFVITNVKDRKNNKYEITGDLTIKGITHSIKFPATINIKNNRLEARAEFKIDRTKWDIRYGSGKFFDNLGDRMIRDDIIFKVKLIANK
ncbi:MAG TPA: YceI family protein [Candidatus Kapabacteria bacterium]|nr:YceI family protein [Candidatus Kapabacteria bacterium]